MCRRYWGDRAARIIKVASTIKSVSYIRDLLTYTADCCVALTHGCAIRSDPTLMTAGFLAAFDPRQPGWYTRSSKRCSRGSFFYTKYIPTAAWTLDCVTNQQVMNSYTCTFDIVIYSLDAQMPTLATAFITAARTTSDHFLRRSLSV